MSSPIHSAEIVQFDHDDADPRRSHVTTDEGRMPLAGFLARHDIIVNCVLQDTESPLTFLIDSDVETLLPGSLVVDVSCDEGMGFSWARPTSFADPTFMIGENVRYYAVDHSPSYLWNSATWEISEALLPHLGTVLDGPAAWDRSDTIRRAVEIRDGVVQNPGSCRSSIARRTTRTPFSPDCRSERDGGAFRPGCCGAFRVGGSSRWPSWVVRRRSRPASGPCSWPAAPGSSRRGRPSRPSARAGG